jgi:hypothetical protein
MFPEQDALRLLDGILFSLGQRLDLIPPVPTGKEPSGQHGEIATDELGHEPPFREAHDRAPGFLVQCIVVMIFRPKKGSGKEPTGKRNGAEAWTSAEGKEHPLRCHRLAQPTRWKVIPFALKKRAQLGAQSRIED